MRARVTSSLSNTPFRSSSQYLPYHTINFSWLNLVLFTVNSNSRSMDFHQFYVECRNFPWKKVVAKYIFPLALQTFHSNWKNVVKLSFTHDVKKTSEKIFHISLRGKKLRYRSRKHVHPISYTTTPQTGETPLLYPSAITMLSLLEPGNLIAPQAWHAPCTIFQVFRASSEIFPKRKLFPKKFFST